MERFLAIANPLGALDEGVLSARDLLGQHAAQITRHPKQCQLRVQTWLNHDCVGEQREGVRDRVRRTDGPGLNPEFSAASLVSSVQSVAFFHPWNQSLVLTD
jgi:hypothetical protein